jgi:3-phenylpropionate/trans-cinnamate dioxygenase ferredoxin reductase subunit
VKADTSQKESSNIVGEGAVVIVGMGVAGATVAATLRRNGFAGKITMIGEEAHLPYQRPPLSKAYLVAEETGKPMSLRPDDFWDSNDIELLTGTRVAAIDRQDRTVVLSDGSCISYDDLVLATGARNRPLPGAHSALTLRTYGEAAALRAQLVAGARLVVIGAGFIGLEVAASAHARGADVVVVEAVDRVMARVASEELSRHLQAMHEAAGVRVLVGRLVRAVEAEAVVLDTGTRLPADVVLSGIGVMPNEELAAGSGLAVDDGIVVDQWLRTSDPAISAAGDCARYPCEISARAQRLESIQNATDQGRLVADRLSGRTQPYRAVPWFWSDQFECKLRIAGVADQTAQSVIRGDIDGGSFSIGRFVNGRLAAVESVNQTPDHIGARKLLGQLTGTGVTPEEFADVERSLKDLASATA